MDAVGLSRKYGLAGRINMICQTVFFRLSNVVPLDDAVALLKASIVKTYGYKGDDVVAKNIDLLEAVVSDPATLIKIDIPESWKKVQLSTGEKPYENRHNRLLDDEKMRKFMTDIADPVSRLEGDDIPVSKFLENHLLGGVMIPGTTKFEKRNPNPSGRIPKWNADSCTQCNQCIFICPHAAIRPFVVTKEEAMNAPFPAQFETIKVTGAEFGGKKYALRVSPLDCTGCNACVEAVSWVCISYSQNYSFIASFLVSPYSVPRNRRLSRCKASKLTKKPTRRTGNMLMIFLNAVISPTRPPSVVPSFRRR